MWGKEWGKGWGKGWGKEKWCNGTQGGTQGGTQDGTQSGTQDDTEGDTQMIPKNKLLTSSTILYIPKNKIREFTHHEQTPPLVYVHVLMNPVIKVMKVTVIKVIKDFGLSKNPSTSLYLIK